MAAPAFSTLLAWQLEEPNTSNTNSGTVHGGISSTYFYSHLPSDEAVWLLMFFCCKTGAGRSK